MPLPPWYPSLNEINKKALQLVQNKALRDITGYTQTTPIDYLHSETKILPIANHLDMLDAQLYSRTHNQTHSNHQLYMHFPPPRNKNNHMLPNTRLHIKPYTPPTRKL